MTQFLQNAVYGTALILAVALLRRTLKDKLAPGARLALWAACLFRLLTPAAPESVFSLWGLLGREARSVPAPMPGRTAAVPAVPGAAVPAVNPAPVPVEGGFPWETLLLGIWLAVGLALAVRYALSYLRTRRAVGHAIPLGRDDPRYAALPKCARLREGPMDGAPLTFGAARPTVVLSPGLEGAALACVLAHEGVHARRRDNLWHYATALALTVFWWNPAVWLMARLLRRDVELSCDRAALKKLGDGRRADYANALVSMATVAEGPAFCQTFGRKAAEERILSIMKYKKMTAVGVALTLVLVFAVTAGFASDPAGQKAEDTVEFHGQTYSRAELSQETLDWLDWYLALDEQEQLAISYVPAELNRGRDTQTQDAEPTPVPVVTVNGMTAAIGTKGEAGYIRESDTLEGQFEALYGPVNTPEDVARYEEWRKTQPSAYTIPLYDAQGNVIGEFAMINPEGEPGFTHDPNGPEDEPICDLPLAPDGSGDEPIACPPEVIDQGFYIGPDGPADGLCGLPTAEEFAKQGNGPVYPVCPVEGCTVRGCHNHDGVTYSCNGAHCGGVCDGTCYSYNGPSRTDCYPDDSGHHGGGHHHGGHH